MSAVQNAAQQFLSPNAQWAEDVKKTDPDFFTNSCKGQAPKVLWIGCADSRVPESVITGAKPGDIFVHRNIANQFHPNDDNVLAVLAYAVDFLGVEHVVIVGHTQCGGAKACLDASRKQDFNPQTTIANRSADDPLNRWLEPLSTLVGSLQESELAGDSALDGVVERNVELQVKNLCESGTIVNAWTQGTQQGQDVYVHGWVYDLATGCLKDLEISKGKSSVSV